VSSEAFWKDVGGASKVLLRDIAQSNPDWAKPESDD